MAYDNDKLGAALKLYLGSNPLPMHMPGHKRNPDLISSEFSRDITEIQGFDNLHSPTGLIRDIETAGAELWGAEKAYVSVGGSTAMLLSAISACNAEMPGSKVLVAMNSHLAVWHALELTGNAPVPLMPVTDGNLPFAGPVSAYDIEKILVRDPSIRMVIITSPTYEGVISDTASIHEITRRYDATLIVDCAHGAHLGLGDDFFGADCHGDIVIKSLHKTLNSPTQTSVMLTYPGCRVQESTIRHYIDIFETSSPSYVLLRGISKCFASVNANKDIMTPWKNGIRIAEDRLSGLKNYKLWLAPVKERSKLVILGDGIDLAERLRGDFGIECEAAFTTHLIAMTGIGDTEDSINRFCDAVLKIDEFSSPQEIKSSLPRPKPVFSLDVREASIKGLKAEEKPLEESAGTICGEFLFCYPPGVPLLVPGELITQDTIDYVRSSGAEIKRPAGCFEGYVKVLP